MRLLLRISSIIDTINERTGRIFIWLTLLMVIVGSYNAVIRYLTQYSDLVLTSNLYAELQWYLFSLVFLMTGAYSLKHNAHVRVDVVFARLAPRVQSWINLTGTVFFLLPFCAAMIWFSWSWVENSWAIREMSPDPGGLPRYPIKSIIPIAFILLAAQGISEAIKEVACLKGLITRPRTVDRADESSMPMEGL